MIKEDPQKKAKFLVLQDLGIALILIFGVGGLVGGWISLLQAMHVF